MIVLAEYVGRDVNDVVKRIASSLLHHIDLVLLKPFEWVIYNSLIAILHILNEVIHNLRQMIFFKLNDEAQFQCLGVHLSRFIIEEEIPVVDNWAREEPLDDELGPFKVNEDLNHTFFNHLDSIHGVSRLKD